MCTNLGICLSVPRNRVIIWGIINIIVGISLLAELVRGEFGVKLRGIKSPNPTATLTENGYHHDDSDDGITTPQPKTESELVDKLAVSRLCCVVVILLFTMVAGIFAILCCNTDQNRKKFATISKLSLTVSIIISMLLAIIDAFASLGKNFGPLHLHNVPTMFVWGSIIQGVWWILLNSYLRHPGLDQDTSGVVMVAI